MARIEEVLEKVGRIERDVGNVGRAIGTMSGELDGARQQIADLQAQIATGTPATEAQLQEVADRLTAVDAELDSIAPDEAPPVEPIPV